ncbi:MAG: hypothetical protein ACRC7S_16675 [Cetobacterium sp.]
MPKKIEKHGQKFDNEYELSFYEYLTGKDIEFEYHKKVNLIPESEHGKAVDWNIDFYLPKQDIYIDTKGLNKTIAYEYLKKRLFQEKFGDKIHFIAQAPVWYQKTFGKVWVEYEVKNKIETLVRWFKKKHDIKGRIDKFYISELIEKIKEKGLMPFDKV